MPLTEPDRPSRVLLAAAAAPAVIGVALAALSVGVVVAAVRGDRSSALNALLLVLLLLGWATGLAVAARGLLAGHRWARSPVVLSELLVAAVGVPLAQGSGSRWAGWALVAVCAVGLVCVLSPPVTAALQD